MKVQNMSVAVAVIGLSAFLIFKGLFGLGDLPFVFDGPRETGMLLLIAGVFLLVEVFKEEKIGLRGLGKSPIAMVEVLIALACIGLAFTQVMYYTIPPAMQNVIFILYILVGVSIALELK